MGPVPHRAVSTASALTAAATAVPACSISRSSVIPRACARRSAPVTGVFFSEVLFGKPFQTNHKTVFSVMSWLVLGGLLAGRYLVGWRGNLAVRWTLIGFVMLLLSYVGSKFVIEVILKRV